MPELTWPGLQKLLKNSYEEAALREMLKLSDRAERKPAKQWLKSSDQLVIRVPSGGGGGISGLRRFNHPNRSAAHSGLSVLALSDPPPYNFPSSRIRPPRIGLMPTGLLRATVARIDEAVAYGAANNRRI
jgi:hypothetical protein